MRNPFQLNGPVQIPIVEKGHDEGDMVSMINMEVARPSVRDKQTLEVSRNISEEFTPDAQHGVQAMEATTIVWTQQHLIAAYVLYVLEFVLSQPLLMTTSRIWLITFVDALQQGTSVALVPFVTSAFAKHSLTAYTGIMSSIIGGVLKLPLAQILNIFGRPQGFALSVAFLILGLVLMAACNGVQVFAAAQIFYWYVGFQCSHLALANTSIKHLTATHIRQARIQWYDIHAWNLHCRHFGSQEQRFHVRIPQFTLHHHSLGRWATFPVLPQNIGLETILLHLFDCNIRRSSSPHVAFYVELSQGCQRRCHHPREEQPHFCSIRQALRDRV
jgi:hypothetical protein